MVGLQNKKWRKEEEEALLAGISKHGVGKWKNILGDPAFAAQLRHRTNIDLKDKWRNLKNRARPIEENSKPQALKSASISISPANTSQPSSADMSNESRYDAMVFEAISTINDENGSDLSGILSFIEERHEVPQNFRKLLSNSLRLLVSLHKLEKVLNRYKISTAKATKPTQILIPKDSVVSTTSKETQEIDSAVEAPADKEAKRIKESVEESDELNRHEIPELEKKLFEEAPEVVAAKLAESDNKSFIAEEAVKEAEQMQKLVEESNNMLQLCLEIHKQCALGKEVLLG